MPDITMTWAVRKHDPESPELVTAWDEYSIDANPEGWEEDKKKSLASWGDDLLRHADIVVYVPYEVIVNAVKPPTVRVGGVIRDRGEQ